MKIYKTQAEVEAEIKDEVFASGESVTFECSVTVKACLRISGDIKARDINAWNIDAWDIKAGDIKARNINAGNINAGNINAWDIKARNINAWNINAGDISFYAGCISCVKFVCKSIKGRREQSFYKCLDSEVKITG